MSKISLHLRLVAVLASVATVLALAGCGSGGSSANKGSVKSASLTWGITSLDSSLDPGLVYNIDPNVITAAMCNSLLQFGPQGQLEPELASSWKQTSPTTYTYELVHDAKFWNGDPVTASDVAFSVNRIASPKLASPLLSLLKTGSIKNAVADGRWKVTINLTRANPIAADLPATPIGQVVEESAVKKWGSAFGSSPAKTMCSGPFKPVSYVKGANTVLDAVPDYWDKSAQPKLKSITFTQVNDAEALIAGLRSGSINGTFDLPAREALTLAGDHSLKVNYVKQGGDINYLSPNLEKGLFKSPLVRRAFNLAIPRAQLASAVDGSYGEALRGIETPALFTSHRGLYMAAYDKLPNPVSPDLAKARALISQAHASGKSVSIAILQSLTSDTVGATLQQVGQSIGVKVNIVKLTPAAFGNTSYSNKCPRTYDALTNYWNPDFPAPSAELVPPLASVYSDVSCYYSNTFDRLRDKWAATRNGSVSQANATIAMLQQVTKDDVYIPMYVDPLVQVEPANLEGYTQTSVFVYQDFPDQVSFR